MKIGIVCPYGMDRGGGVQEIVLAMQAELNERGHDAYIITPHPQNDDFKPPSDRMIFIGNATDVKMPSKTTIQMSAGLAEAIDNMFEEYQFDILHFHEPWIPLISYQLLKRSPCVNVATFHANVPPSPMVRTLTKAANPWARLVIKHIDGYTAVSEAAAEHIRGLINEPVTIIPNALHLDEWTPATSFNDDAKQKTILYVGRLEGRKGVKYLLEAFGELQARHPDVSLLVCGDGADREKLELLAEDLELKNVTFKGYISDDQKRALYKSSDLYCSPAVYGESFGVVLLEAMASGTVTVAGDNPGYSGVMTGVGSVSLVDPKHTQEFARRLELLLYEKELRQLWRKWAAREIGQYSYQKIVDQYEAFYKQALKKKRH